MRRLALILFFLLTAGCNQTPVARFEVLTPRPFGYVIGDEIPMRVVFDASPGTRLEKAGLPRPGAVNRWLELKSVKLDQDGRRYRLDLVYQVFYAPRTVKSLVIPGFDLALRAGDAKITRAVPPWTFTVAPLREVFVRQNGQFDYIRSDDRPKTPGAAAAARTLAAGLALAAAAALGLVASYGYLPLRSSAAVFRKTVSALARLSPQDMATALALVHGALNRIYGKPLFRHQLPAFLSAYPSYRPAAGRLEWFFNYSDHYFFSHKVTATPSDLQQLLKLCRLCRQLADRP